MPSAILSCTYIYYTQSLLKILTMVYIIIIFYQNQYIYQLHRMVSIELLATY